MAVKVGIINSTGYAGAEIVRLLARHPEVDIVGVTGRSNVGKSLGEVFPHLGEIKSRITATLETSVDFVFSALPHAASASVLEPFIRAGTPCVDVSADFRLTDVALYERWYGVTHPCPDLNSQAVYGLPELHRTAIQRTKLVANPGCFPTGTILGMVPAMAAGLVESGVISDSKTGVSGAGRTAKAEYGFSELNDSIVVYGLSGHRHTPEMEQELSKISTASNVNVLFVPTLVPITRGILGTNYARLNKIVTTEQVRRIYADYYADEPFVRIVKQAPSTKHTWGSNMVLVYPYVCENSGYLVVVTALDNLVKGAAGAAVQNMNLMMRWPEYTGLEGLPIYP